MAADKKMASTWSEGHAVDDDDVVARVKEVVRVEVADGGQRDGQLAVAPTKVFVSGLAMGNDLGPETSHLGHFRPISATLGAILASLELFWSL